MDFEQWWSDFAARKFPEPNGLLALTFKEVASAAWDAGNEAGYDRGHDDGASAMSSVKDKS
jgi:hypothetical protein